MAPSRGVSAVHDASDDHAIHQQSNSALANARRNFSYLIDPTKAAGGQRPARLRTRALLRSLRYITQFILWRLVRWAKYAAVGALVAAISATAVGSVITGAAWIVAPPSIGASIIAASVWGTGKFAARRLNKRWKNTGMDAGHEERESHGDAGSTKERRYGTALGPQELPW